MISRRSFLRGLVAAPAVVAASSLMPLRGVILPTAKEVFEFVPLPDSIGPEMMALLKARMDECYKVMAINISKQLYGV